MGTSWLLSPILYYSAHFSALPTLYTPHSFCVPHPFHIFNQLPLGDPRYLKQSTSSNGGGLHNFATWKKQVRTVQNGDRKCGTRPRVFSKTLKHLSSKNEIWQRHRGEVSRQVWIWKEVQWARKKYVRWLTFSWSRYSPKQWMNYLTNLTYTYNPSTSPGGRPGK